MANITKRTNKNGEVSYLIRAFVYEGKNGKQRVKSMTWKPSPNMTQKQIEKELKRQEVIFEDKVKNGLVAIDGSITFEEYAAHWLKNSNIAPKTYERYADLLKRINIAIGHIRLDRLQAHHLEEFYKNLRENGISGKGKFAVSDKLDKILKKKKLSKAKTARLAGVAPSTVSTACKGKHISILKAEQICDALGINIDNVFKVCDNTKGLSDKTIHHHHALISAILNKAKRERVIPFNVAAEHTAAPTVRRKEAVYMNDGQAREFVSKLAHEEDIRVKTALLLMLYSGMRRGELCGLNWNDIDKDKCIVHVCRASQYQRKKGVVEVPTKNTSSERSIKLPKVIMDQLTKYNVWWAKQKLLLGTAWKGTNDRLFVQYNGKPINPDTINYWLDKFLKKHKLPKITPHGLRHTFATLQITAGVDLRTLQARTGHAQASTLVNVYSHAIRSAEENATEALDNILTPKDNTDAI